MNTPFFPLTYFGIQNFQPNQIEIGYISMYCQSFLRFLAWFFLNCIILAVSFFFNRLSFHFSKIFWLHQKLLLWLSTIENISKEFSIQSPYEIKLVASFSIVRFHNRCKAFLKLHLNNFKDKEKLRLQVSFSHHVSA